MTKKQAYLAANLMIGKFIFELLNAHVIQPEDINLHTCQGLEEMTTQERSAIMDAMEDLAVSLTKGNIRFNSLKEVLEYARTF